jgi:hypothetical protein
MSLTIPTDCVPGVLEDLAALLLAGESSEGTRRFLEAHARQDPAFAKRLNAATRIDLAPPPPAATDDSLQTIQLIRQYVALRTIFTAMGIAFTLIPLAFTFSGAGAEFLFLGKQPGIVSSFWSIAAASWVAMWIMHRQIRKRGI